MRCDCLRSVVLASSAAHHERRREGRAHRDAPNPRGVVPALREARDAVRQHGLTRRRVPQVSADEEMGSRRVNRVPMARCAGRWQTFP